MYYSNFFYVKTHKPYQNFWNTFYTILLILGLLCFILNILLPSTSETLNINLVLLLDLEVDDITLDILINQKLINLLLNK